MYSNISVVVPFYNTPVEYFRECVESLQRLKPGEIILVDDCSTDNMLVDYARSVDSDDRLLAFPFSIAAEVNFSKNKRVLFPSTMKLEHLILAPRAICNGMVVKREIAVKYSYPLDPHVFGDVLFALRILHNHHTWVVNDTVNYDYRKRDGSIQTSKPLLYHRYRLVETVARFCSLENLSEAQAERYLKLALLNFKYGSKSLQLYEQHSRERF